MQIRYTKALLYLSTHINSEKREQLRKKPMVKLVAFLFGHIPYKVAGDLTEFRRRQRLPATPIAKTEE